MGSPKLPKSAALVTILGRLDARETLTAAPLAEALGVTRRSIFRYLDSLQAAGYPIYFDRTSKSYRFVEDYQLRYSSSEKRLTRALELKRKVMQSTSVGIASYGVDGKCILANDGQCHQRRSIGPELSVPEIVA